MTETMTQPASKRPRRMAREPEPQQPAAQTLATPPTADSPPLSPPAVKIKQPGKTDAVLALLRREDGATLAELMAATGWLAHSTRAALTGLRKKGHGIERSKRGEDTCYRIAGAA
ncbi:DUF3489 domain-containing protein [Novosphingobium aquae]|uniref:DUF3489 domain-containing protein n=1 Tax=Novosphingobium aquae TaxID=3133435 RepID=A0ABU8S927_9SPHN